MSTSDAPIVSSALRRQISTSQETQTIIILGQQMSNRGCEMIEETPKITSLATQAAGNDEDSLKDT